MNARIHPLWPSWVVLAALVLLFVGERIFAASTTTRLVFAALAATMLIAAVAVRAGGWSTQQDPGRKPVLRTVMLSTAGVAAAIGLYALIPTVFTGDDSASERFRGVLWALWPILLAMSGFVLVSVESAVAPVAYIDRYEHAQIRRSTHRGLSLALFLAVLFVGNYLVIRHDHKFELDAGHSATAGTQTRQIVRDLTKKVKVVVFYARANDVAPRVEGYFEPLKGLNENLEIVRMDHALATDLAKKAQVTDNGVVALYHEDNHEKIAVGKDYRSVRSALRRFDTNFAKALIRVTTSKKTAYFYQGHAERPIERPRSSDMRPRLVKLKRQLENWQYTVKPLSVADGAAAQLPDDADLVFIMGPEKPFLQSEINVLTSAVQRGARLFIALDSGESAEPLDDLLGPLGLKLDRTPLAATESKVPITRTAADRSFIYSSQFSSHESVTWMTRNTASAVAIFYKAASLEKNDEQKLKNAKLDVVLTARPDTFRDTNNNRLPDQGEVARTHNLAAAITVTSTTGDKAKEGRVFVLAGRRRDGRPGVRPPERQRLLFARHRAVAAESRRDVHSRQPQGRRQNCAQGAEDALIFYGTTFAVPAFILIGGAFATRRRRRS